MIKSLFANSPTQKLVLETHGRRFDVTAAFVSDLEANTWMLEHPEDCVIAVLGKLILIANKRDMGRKIVNED